VIRRAALLLGLAAVALGGCLQLAQFREPFVAPGRAMAVAWRRQLSDRELFGGHRIFMRDGKPQRFGTGIDLDYKPQEFSSATSDGRRVFVGSQQGVLWALAAEDGRLLWRRPLSGPISSEPAYVVELGLVLVGDDDGALWAIDPKTGKERWVYRARGPITARPTYADGLVFFTSAENRVYAIDAQKGTWKWQYDREAPDGFTIRGQGGPLAAGGKVYVGFADGYLAALEGRTGDIVWVRALGTDGSHYADVDSTPTLVGGTLYASSIAGGVYAIDPKDGSVRWRYEVEGAGTVRVRGGRVYFAAGKNGLHCLDLTGHVLWHQALPQAGELSSPLVVAGWVVVSAADSGTYVADAQSGRLDQFLMPGHGITGAPTSDGRHVFVVSNAGFVYALAITRPRS
jgi:outer membrane protein assembly factor BamB